MSHVRLLQILIFNIYRLSRHKEESLLNFMALLCSMSCLNCFTIHTLLPLIIVVKACQAESHLKHHHKSSRHVWLVPFIAVHASKLPHLGYLQAIRCTAQRSSAGVLIEIALLQAKISCLLDRQMCLRYHWHLMLEKPLHCYCPNFHLSALWSCGERQTS